jgi:hypothetical protein
MKPMTVDWTHVLLEQFDLEWNLAHGPSLETLTDEARGRQLAGDLRAVWDATLRGLEWLICDLKLDGGSCAFHTGLAVVWKLGENFLTA